MNGATGWVFAGWITSWPGKIEKLPTLSSSIAEIMRKTYLKYSRAGYYEIRKNIKKKREKIKKNKQSMPTKNQPGFRSW